MSDYDVYKTFGHIISTKESEAKMNLIFAKWYEKPFIKFTIWKERVKRYLGADIKLKSDNPFGCLFWCCVVVLILAIMIIGKLIL